MELEVIISINWPKIGGFHWAFFVHPPKSVEVLGPYGSELLSWMRIWVKSSKRPEFKDIRWLKKINLNKAALLTAETWALGWLPVIYPLGDGFVGDVFFSLICVAQLLGFSGSTLTAGAAHFVFQSHTWPVGAWEGELGQGNAEPELGCMF